VGVPKYAANWLHSTKFGNSVTCDLPPGHHAGRAGVGAGVGTGVGMGVGGTGVGGTGVGGTGVGGTGVGAGVGFEHQWVQASSMAQPQQVSPLTVVHMYPLLHLPGTGVGTGVGAGVGAGVGGQ
jgi:hypothetical protein